MVINALNTATGEGEDAHVETMTIPSGLAELSLTSVARLDSEHRMHLVDRAEEFSRRHPVPHQGRGNAVAVAPSSSANLQVRRTKAPNKSLTLLRSSTDSGNSLNLNLDSFDDILADNDDRLDGAA
jgi:hypothetical protein